MSGNSRAGRPRASSRETLTEAACELFLEQGYEATSVADIARRAGVSRSSFFNYFTSKSDLLWGECDRRLGAAVHALDAAPTLTADAVCEVLRGIVTALQPDALTMAIRDAATMGLAEELPRERAERVGRLAAAIARGAERSGIAPLRAAVMGAAYATATLAAVEQWSLQAGSTADLVAEFERAMTVAADIVWA